MNIHHTLNFTVVIDVIKRALTVREENRWPELSQYKLLGPFIVDISPI